MVGRAGLSRHLAGLALFAGVYFAIFLIGYHWAEDGFFHRFFDQVSYRYEAAKVAEGFHRSTAEGLTAAWNQTTAQGITYPLLGGIAYWLGFDPAHLMFGVFLAGMIAVWIAFSSAGRQPWLGWLALALFTSTTTLLNKTGGPIDYRPDFIGQISWTAATALALGSRAFASRRACVALGVLLGLAFCSRSFLLAYAAAALPLCLLAAWIGAPLETAQRRQRVTNLALVVGIACAIAAPLFVHNFDRLWDYYVDNHLSQKENEARGYNRTFAENFPNYIRSLRRNHVGWAAGFLMLATLCLTLRGTLRTHARRWPALLIWLAFMLPLAVLAIFPQFSSTVSGVVAGSAVFLALVAARTRARRLAPPYALGGSHRRPRLAVWPARFLYKCTRDHDKRIAAGHHLVAAQHRAILEHTAGRTGVMLNTKHGRHGFSQHAPSDRRPLARDARAGRFRDHRAAAAALLLRAGSSDLPVRLCRGVRSQTARQRRRAVVGRRSVGRRLTREPRGVGTARPDRPRAGRGISAGRWAREHHPARRTRAPALLFARNTDGSRGET